MRLHKVARGCKRLLAIDIGNTNISFGIFKGRGLARKFNILTPNYTAKKLRASLGKRRVDDAIICSVVPDASRALNQDLKRLGVRTYNIGKDIEIPLENLYRLPKQVGQDRLVNAYAGVRLYGAPLIIVDFGTAVTFDIISRNKEYLGGMILPGLSISLDALYQRTALLPRVKLARPREFIGGDSKNSILSGLVYGFAGLTDALVAKIAKKIGKDALAIGTGGNIRLMARYARQLDKIDPELTLKGLNLIYQDRI